MNLKPFLRISPRSLKSVDFKLFFTLLIMTLIPTIYTTVRIHFLGDLPSDWGFNIASQLTWVNVAYEVVQEAIILPLFYLMGKSLLDKQNLENKIQSGLVVTAAIYLSMSLILILFARPIVEFMSQKNELVSATVTYIRIETVASIFSTLLQFLLLVLITIKKEKYLVGILLVQMVLTIALDTFFVSTLSFSLNVGVNGIAYSNIIVNLLLVVLALFLLHREGYRVIPVNRLQFGWMKEWLTVGGYSGIESFVRNAAFTLMVVRMVNVVGEQGTFWVANSFIWGWLLMPVLQLGQLVKRDCGELGNRAIEGRTLGYFVLTGIFILIWIVTIPLWEPFISNVMNIENSGTVTHLALISLVFYITFAFNNVIDSIFYGIGKTNYMLFQSVVINAVFYGTLFVLYVTDIYNPSLELIALMFAGGIAFDSLLTYIMFVWMLKKRKLNITTPVPLSEEAAIADTV